MGNKTSQAVEDMLKTHYVDCSGSDKRKEVDTILKKYKRMEEMLEAISDLADASHLAHIILAQEALSYDPLDEQ